MPETFFMWRRRLYGAEGGQDSGPYLTQFWIGRLRLHIFHRGDIDPDPHDHPWGFWTFPLTPYVEEVVKFEQERPHLVVKTVPAFRVSYREASHTHRVLGRSKGGPTSVRVEDMLCKGKIVTIVWRARASRSWGSSSSGTVAGAG